MAVGTEKHTAGWKPPLALFLAVVLAFLPAVGVLAKQSLTVSFTVLALGLLAVGFGDRSRWRPDPVSGGWFLLLVLGAVLLWLAAWEGDARAAIPKLLMLALILWAVRGSLVDGFGVAASRLLVGLTVGVVLGCMVALVELAFDSPLHRFFGGVGFDAKVEPSRYNRGISNLVILVWPAAAWLQAMGRRDGAVGLVILALACAALGQSSAALLAGAVGAAVYVVALRWPREVLGVGTGLASVFVIGAPWLMSRALEWGGPLFGQIPRSFFHRLEIWDHAAAKALEHPWIGHGINAYRTLRIEPDQLAQYRIMTFTEPHTHNVAIQAWVEFGVFGALMMAALIVMTARAIGRLPAERQAAAIACFAVVFVTAMLSYGLWQQTWMSMMAMAALGFLFPMPEPRENG